MRHVTCDSCKRDLSERGGAHYTVKMETQKLPSSTALTDHDFYGESDSVHEMELMMKGAFEEAEMEEPREAPMLRKEYDFCGDCYAKFCADPLGLERAGRRRFSTN